LLSRRRCRRQPRNRLRRPRWFRRRRFSHRVRQYHPRPHVRHSHLRRRL